MQHSKLLLKGSLHNDQIPLGFCNFQLAAQRSESSRICWPTFYSFKYSCFLAMTDAKHRKFFPDLKSKTMSNQEERRMVLLVTHISPLGLALKCEELNWPALPPRSPTPEHQLQPPCQKGVPKQLPRAFPAFSYHREDQCILKLDTCSVFSSQLLLFMVPT